jgi:hypothetical protein
MALIECSECGKEISDKAKGCVHCGCPISFSLEKTVTIEQTPKTDSRVAPDPKEVNKTLYVFLLLGAVFLHVLFCAESPLLFLSASNPSKSIIRSMGYSVPGILVSVIFLAPIFYYFGKFGKGKLLKAVTVALYIGAAIRLFIFFLN